MNYVEFIKALGFSVYMRNPDDTYCYYTDDNNQIGYAQWSDCRQYVTSVHKANSTSGTGFRVADAITESTLLAALATYTPHWAVRDASSVKKWRDWEEFQTSSAWQCGFSRV